MRQTKYILYILVFLLTVASSCKDNQFVKVHNGRFYSGSKPYYYFGINFWHGAYLGANLIEGDKERLLKELDLLAENHITNLRIMASSEETDLERAVNPTFLNKNGEINSRLSEGLDFLLAEMAKRDMKAVLVLNNYWQWSGGMAQYKNWVSGNPIIDPDKTGDWTGFQIQSAGFYSDSTCNALFQQYIKKTILRENSITKRLYRDDPTIMAWQLANEPRPAPGALNNQSLVEEFSEWINNTAKYIHSIDPNHLVSSGNEGSGGCRGSEEIYLESHKSPYIDYLTFHIWPKNWGWYDATNPDETFNTAIQNTQEYLTNHIEIAHQLNKPIVLEEFGMERDEGFFTKTTTTSYRDKYIEFVLSEIVKYAKNDSPISGFNLWTWGGYANSNQENFLWQTGDSFMGDPPQEPQGLNSVFSTDTTTLNLFKRYNAQIAEIDL